MQFCLRTTFLFSGINPIGMTPADESRILLLELVMHENDEKIAKHIRREEGYFSEKGPEWCGYMVTHALLVAPAIEKFSDAMPGIDSRLRKNLATLLAGAFIALHARVPSESEAKEMAAEYAESVVRHSKCLDRDDARECLEYLFAHVVEKFPLGHWAAHEIIAQRSGEDKERDINTAEPLRILSIHGMKIIASGEKAGLYLLNKSHAIDRIFSGTRWSQFAWEKALRKLTGAFVPKFPIYFPIKGDKARAIGIPLEEVPQRIPECDLF